MKNVGLDISTSCVGVSINDNGSYFYSYFKPKKTKSIIADLSNTTKTLITTIGANPDSILIEQPIQHMPAKSSAATIIKLNVIAHSVAVGLYNEFGIEPEFVNVNTVRAKIKRMVGSKDRLKKEDMPTALNKILLKKLPIYIGKDSVIKPETYDVADSAAVLVFGENR